MAVTSVILFQVFYLLNCRSLRDSILHIGLTSNPWVFVGISTILGLQGAFIYAPPLQAVFGSTPLEVTDLVLAALVGAVILPIVSLEKRLIRPRRSGKG